MTRLVLPVDSSGHLVSQHIVRRLRRDDGGRLGSDFRIGQPVRVVLVGPVRCVLFSWIIPAAAQDMARRARGDTPLWGVFTNTHDMYILYG